jgi:hypothetical protein
MSFGRTIKGLLAIAFSTALSEGAELDYGKDIQPLLAEHCYACHGPDSKTRKAGLRFDQREVATGELKSGERAIVPGDLEASEMVRRLFSTDPDEMMPPPDFRKRPTDGAKARLAEWVKSGANYQQHWAFEPVVKQKLPKVKNAQWPRNAIDHFILARLEKNNMTPSPEAGRSTLVRRMSLDFRGLPPLLSEVDDLSRDNTEELYARLIDTMINSEHYGERMAQDWLDLARFGDTNGYHNDSERAMWLYRDYVIDSFNQNKPFDRFIIENMAGDLLPDADDTTRIASGFNRCVTFNEEGGADPDEFYVTYAVDRANTTGQVFLGLTVGCAQCHDHKYDPISQKEFYQLYAFFNSVDGEIGAGGRSGYHNKPLPPLLKVQSPTQKKKIAELDERLASKSNELEEARKRPEFTNPKGPLAEAARAWATLLKDNAPTSLEVRNGLQLHLDASALDAPGGIVKAWLDQSGNGHNAIATGTPKQFGRAINGRPAVRLDGKGDFLRTSSGGEKLAGDFTIITVLKFLDLKTHQMAVMWGEEAKGKRRALWKTDKNKFAFNGHQADVVGNADFRVNQAAIAIVTKSGGDNLVRFNLNGAASGEGKTPLAGYANKAITIGANNAGLEKTSAEFAEVLLYERALDPTEQAKVGLYLGRKYGIATTWETAPKELLAIVGKEEKERTEDDQQGLFNHFVQKIHPASRDLFQKLEGEFANLKSEREQATKQSTATTMVMVEMKKRKPAHILMRGDFRQPGAEVEPDVPAIFPRLPEDQPRNRLGLAYWLTDPKHPLVARVMVNRLWKQLFGIGLVKTLGDFGTQGERPSHPLLLDWLAADFIEHGWDVKRLKRLMVTSATYRQASINHGRYDTTDPGNRVHSRAARFRLSAEEVRDAALSVSGLLNREIGGPSVYPHQPANYLSSIGKGWKESSGKALYRRGLYTFWRRTMLYPTFQIFDAPSREFCAVNRPRTNTPLQALVTLNDPSFVEAARTFGERILNEGGAEDEARLTFAFANATSRRPTAAELVLLKESLAEQRSEFGANAELAKQLAADKKAADPPEMAAWTTMANILLNLDESITRE